MAQSIVGAENVQPYKFSECSKSDYEDALKNGRGICLFNKPNELENRSCGNRVIDDGEQCDCGTIAECPELDPCCDPITCKLTSEAQCASGECCDNCKLRPRGYVCRDATNECDLPETCTGDSGQCPIDVYKKNGKPCADNHAFCFGGFCPDLNVQCSTVWGISGSVADMQCFEQFNSKGSINGHCGTDKDGHYIKCDLDNVQCGSLQCQEGSKEPVIAGMDPWSRTIISSKGTEYECKATSGKVEGKEVPVMGLVRDGTSCGDNLVCTNVNKCYCDAGWGATDCSLKIDIPTLEPITTTTIQTPGKTTESSSSKHQKKETPYGMSNVFLKFSHNYNTK
ncbi:hypothetical protein PV328_007925 [Microctonus aethiopoides]|uniref:Disintegrin domain-containing protein n=2 Tax=Microctonus TaxID=144405 RepID=A0AA39C9W4_9HYME|nr:hypothetical protein PV328_007925 [Microctonus aethiopoides]